MLKTLIRGLIPPLAWQAARAFKPKYRTYPNWDAAAAAAGDYQNETLTAFRIARAGAHVSLQENALAWLPRFLGGHVSIVDFGGATGEIGLALRASGAEVSYTVVENDTLVSMMPEGAGFTSQLPDVCDVFYTSGTLHYLPDPYSVLERGFCSARQAVVLRRNNFSEREVFRVQTTRLFDNGSGPIPPGFTNIEIRYPNRTIREASIHQAAERYGFYLFSRTPEFEGVPVPQEGIYGAQLVFLKNQFAGPRDT